jgi:hypothetical protein
VTLVGTCRSPQLGRGRAPYSVPALHSCVSCTLGQGQGPQPCASPALLPPPTLVPAMQVDVTAVLYDGSFHEVDSSALAFQIAARCAWVLPGIKGRPGPCFVLILAALLWLLLGILLSCLTKTAVASSSLHHQSHAGHSGTVFVYLKLCKLVILVRFGSLALGAAQPAAPSLATGCTLQSVLQGSHAQVRRPLVGAHHEGAVRMGAWVLTCCSTLCLSPA